MRQVVAHARTLRDEEAFVSRVAIHWPSGNAVSVGSDGQLCLTPLNPERGAVRYSWKATLDAGVPCHFVAVSERSCVGATASLCVRCV